MPFVESAPSNNASVLDFVRPPHSTFPPAPLVEAVIALVREVSARELMPRFRHVHAERKLDGSLVTEADRAVEGALAAALPGLFDCPVLGEEMPELEQRRIWREADWFWCVDPLDGTTNFANGKRYFGISVALMRGRNSVFGVVFDPNRGEVFHALRDGGAYLNGRRLKPGASRRLAESLVEVGRFKRLGRLGVALFEHRPFRKLAMSGASVLQWCHMACGRTDAFLHAGEQPWDYAAGALILEEAGGRIATLHHDDYWKSDGSGDWAKSVIAARHPALFDEWKRWVRNHL